MEIKDNCVVSIHYTLTSEEGSQLDSSEDQGPLVYLHGSNNLIPGLERELSGKSVGDKLEVTVQPEDAYGPVRSDLIKTVPASAFEGVENIERGMQFEAKGPEGQSQLITVQEVTDDGIKVNGNHPLAGEVLHFKVTIDSVREATKEEVEHGHVH